MGLLRFCTCGTLVSLLQNASLSFDLNVLAETLWYCSPRSCCCCSGDCG